MGIQSDENLLSSLFFSHYGLHPEAVRPLAAAGSDRRYYIIESDKEASPVIGTVGNDLEENRTFIYLARHLASENLPVPRIIAETPDARAYLQSYVGRLSLFDFCENARTVGEYGPAERSILENAIRLLARIQFRGGRNLDFSHCYPEQSMNENLVRWDLNYFKYCFLKPQEIAFNESRLQSDFDRLEDCLLQDRENWRCFMYRDFQSRNVMVGEDGRLTAIDFQGGRRGPEEYDVASFLWQAKAAYPVELRLSLIDRYCDEAERISPSFDKGRFCERLPYFVLFRVLQTLGAYGFRGGIERRPHFLQSIPAGVKNLKSLFDKEFPALSDEYPELYAVAISAHNKILLPADESVAEGLTVTVQSFSYRKGYPTDLSGNGGGFIFDCRAIHNPGRYEQYKPLTGMDTPVKEFLEADGEIFPFLENARQLVDAAVRKYIKRGFTSLSVGFGCTGGRHRSVYSAHAMAEYLRKEFPQVNVREIHREQPILNTTE